jgi:hypothetical protein
MCQHAPALLHMLLLVPQRASNSSSSPDLLAKFALAAHGNQAAARSPKWFGSAALQDEIDEAAEQAAGGYGHNPRARVPAATIYIISFNNGCYMHSQRQ